MQRHAAIVQLVHHHVTPMISQEASKVLKELGAGAGAGAVSTYVEISLPRTTG